LKEKEPKVAVVIVNWNQRELLLEAVGSCMSSHWSNLLMIVVDNGSRDGSAKAVTEAFPDTVMVQNEFNEGFAVGSNQGIKHAREAGVEYILFLNNDATLEPDAIGKMVELMEKNTMVGAVAPYIFYYDRRDIIWYGGGIVQFWRGRIAHRFLRQIFHEDEHQPSPTRYLTGCVFMVRVEALKSVGFFDTTMGLYSEDVDFCLRLRYSGWRLWVTPDAKAYHRISVTAGGELSPFKAFHRGRSNAMLTRRWANIWEWPTIIIGGILGGLFITLKLMIGGKLSTLLALWYGVINGLVGGGIPGRYSFRKGPG